MSISLDGISSVYTSEYLDSGSTSKVEEALNNADIENASDDELLEVCKQFETYFVEQVFKKMKETMLSDDKDSELMSGSKTLDYFEDMLVQEYAGMVTEKSELGLAQQLYEQMKRNYNL